MLDQVDLSTSLSKADAKARLDELKPRLFTLQNELWRLGVPLVVVFEGWDCAGKGECISLLAEILDPRGFKVHVTFEPSEEEAARPYLWRFWTKTPEAGQIALFDRSWHMRLLTDRVDEVVKPRTWRRGFEEIAEFERQLADGGVRLVKFFLHISKGEQRRRFEEFEASPTESWRVRKEDWRHHRHYREYREAAEEMIARTDAANARWTLIPAESLRFARVRVVERLIEEMEEGLAAAKARDPKGPSQTKPVAPKAAPRSRDAVPTILDHVDLSLKITDEKKYRADLVELQTRLRDLEIRALKRKTPTVIVYEGWDAAGKGGNIKRLAARLDPRAYDVHSISKPTEEEQRHHYLWRFWTKLPRAGHMAIFDRSWYGRVLVERVEGFCTEEDWRRAYQEINEFERQLSAFGAVVIKLWIHIDAEEQAKRFKARLDTPEKRWKISEEDWRNRKKWALYRPAVVEMLERTSTAHAPWVIVEGNDKWYARLKALRTVIERLEDELYQSG